MKKMNKQGIYEEAIKGRKEKIILLSTKHFFEAAKDENLFSSFEKADEITKRAIKGSGVLVKPFMSRNDCHYHCIFKSDLGKTVCCPIIAKKNNVFFVPTIYLANLWQKNAYDKAIKTRKIN